MEYQSYFRPSIRLFFWIKHEDLLHMSDSWNCKLKGPHKLIFCLCWCIKGYFIQIIFGFECKCHQFAIWSAFDSHRQDVYYQRYKRQRKKATSFSLIGTLSIYFQEFCCWKHIQFEKKVIENHVHSVINYIDLKSKCL